MAGEGSFDDDGCLVVLMKTEGWYNKDDYDTTRKARLVN